MCSIKEERGQNSSEQLKMTRFDVTLLKLLPLDFVFCFQNFAVLETALVILVLYDDNNVFVVEIRGHGTLPFDLN